ncbi:Kinesin light chain, partial [Diplonema papillatum]
MTAADGKRVVGVRLGEGGVLAHKTSQQAGYAAKELRAQQPLQSLIAVPAKPRPEAIEEDSEGELECLPDAVGKYAHSAKPLGAWKPTTKPKGAIGAHTGGIVGESLRQQQPNEPSLLEPQHDTQVSQPEPGQDQQQPDSASELSQSTANAKSEEDRLLLRVVSEPPKLLGGGATRCGCAGVTPQCCRNAVHLNLQAAEQYRLKKRHFAALRYTLSALGLCRSIKHPVQSHQVFQQPRSTTPDHALQQAGNRFSLRIANRDPLNGSVGDMQNAFQPQQNDAELVEKVVLLYRDLRAQIVAGLRPGNNSGGQAAPNNNHGAGPHYYSPEAANAPGGGGARPGAKDAHLDHLSKQDLENLLQKHHAEGCAARERGNLKTALHELQEVLNIRVRLVGEMHPETALARSHVATVIRDTGNLKGAMVELRKALKIQETVLGEGHPHVAVSHNNIGAVLKHQGRSAEALMEHRKALVILVTYYKNATNKYVAEVHEHIGHALRLKNDVHGATVEYAQALAIRKKVFPADHPKTTRLEVKLAGLSELWTGPAQTMKGVMLQEGAQRAEKAKQARTQGHRKSKPSVLGADFETPAAGPPLGSRTSTVNSSPNASGLSDEEGTKATANGTDGAAAQDAEAAEDFDPDEWACPGCGWKTSLDICSCCSYRRPLPPTEAPQLFNAMVFAFTGIIPKSVHPSAWSEWRLAEQRGAKCVEDIDENVTHLIYREGYERSGKVQQAQQLHTKIVLADWFYQSVNLGILLDESSFLTETTSSGRLTTKRLTHVRPGGGVTRAQSCPPYRCLLAPPAYRGGSVPLKLPDPSFLVDKGSVPKCVSQSSPRAVRPRPNVPTTSFASLIVTPNTSLSSPIHFQASNPQGVWPSTNSPYGSPRSPMQVAPEPAPSCGRTSAFTWVSRTKSSQDLHRGFGHHDALARSSSIPQLPPAADAAARGPRKASAAGNDGSLDALLYEHEEVVFVDAPQQEQPQQQQEQQQQQQQQ